MKKELSYNIGKEIREQIERPLRTRSEIILVLLKTIRMFDISSFFPDSEQEKVYISINRMSRIFYVLKNKIFSFQFPFSIEVVDEKIRIYERQTNIEITATILSVLISFFEKAKDEMFTFEDFFISIMNEDDRPRDIADEQLWEIVKNLATYDLGYLRYDYDEKNFKQDREKLHPINHLDICFDQSVTFKLGLDKGMNYLAFKDMLDTTTDCMFISN